VAAGVAAASLRQQRAFETSRLPDIEP
jgi:hypothetical protein